MEILLNLFKYFAYGLLGLFVFLVLVTLIFGKRVIKKWEYEANFYNDKRREIGEFDIEMRKYEKEETDFALKAKFVLRHPELELRRVVQVYLNDVLVMEGQVEKEGYIFLNNEHLKDPISNPQEGQICRVLCGSVELFSEPILDDSLSAKRQRKNN